MAGLSLGMPNFFIMTILKRIFNGLFVTPLSKPSVRLTRWQRFFIRGTGAAGLSMGMPNFLSVGPGLPGFLPALPLLTLLFPAALFILGLAAPSRRAALRSGFLTALPAFATALYWLGYPLHNQGGLPVVATIPFIVALAAYLAFFPALFSLLVRLTSEKISPRSLWLGVLGGVFWFFQEALCSVLFTGFPWLDLSMAFVPWPMLIQLASFIGAYGLAGFMAALACLGAQVLLPGAWLSPEHSIGQTAQDLPGEYSGSQAPASADGTPLPGRLRCGAVLAVGCVIWLGYGWHALRAEAVAATPENSIYVGLIQGNIDQDQKWDRRYRDRTIRVYKGLSRDVLDRLGEQMYGRLPHAQTTGQMFAGAEGQDPGPAGQEGQSGQAQNRERQPLPLLLIWPETSMPFESAEDSADYQDVRHFVDENNTNLLFGNPKFNMHLQKVPGGPIEPENQASLIGPEGELLGGYSKEHLVPFGEYVPLELNELPVIKEVFEGILQGVGTFKPGPPDQSFPRIAMGSAGLDIGMLICYESIFPELANERTSHANLLVNISNDTWFGRSAAPLQHLYLSALRAVEQRRYLARCTNSGISAVIDDKGRIVANSSLFEATSVLAQVRLLEEKSPYYRLSSLLGQIFKVF